MTLILNGTTGEVFPTWTTAGRPASPSTGQTGFNTTTGQIDVYNGASWVSGSMSATQGTSGQYLQSNGTGSAPSWATFSASTGNLIRAPQFLISGTSYTTPSNCTMIHVELLGGGGGGAGNTGTGASYVRGCGSAGAYTYKTFTVTGSTSYTYAIGAGGTGANNGVGGAGGDTTFAVGATTVTATGGNGGAAAAGYTAGVTSTNGDINFTSQGGFINGIGNLAFGGSASPFGQGGARLLADANTAGNAASGYGSGGTGSNGASTGTAGRAGGNGSQGFIRIWEFT
jgi:hypothetical protein